MRTARTLCAGVAAYFALGLPSTASAQQPPDQAAAQALRAEIDQLRSDFATRLAALEVKLAAITGETPPPAAGC